MRFFSQTFKAKKRPASSICRRLLVRLVGARRGAMAVEFAIVFPIFLIMCLALVEVGRAFWIKSTIQFAAEETSRYAMARVDPDNVSGALSASDQTTLENYFSNRLSGLKGVGAPTFAVDTTGSVEFLTVTSSYTYTVIMPLVKIPDVTLNARSRVPLLAK